MENDDTNTAGTSAVTPSPGMTQIRNAVEFTEAHVLKPEAAPMTGTANLMVDQAAAMMIQDAGSYLQGNEQILMMATSKALAMLVNPDTQIQAAGTAALAEIAVFQATLPVFATAVGTAAAGIVQTFDGA